MRGLSQQSRSGSSFQPIKPVPYGVRTSDGYRATRQSLRRGAIRAKKLEEQLGILLDPKKCLRMELKRNSGIGWTRSLTVCMRGG